MRLTLLTLLGLLVLGCDSKPDTEAVVVGESAQAGAADGEAVQTLAEARSGFQTKIVVKTRSVLSPDQPPAGVFDLIKYPSAVGDLAAYVTPDPGDGKKHPAIVWITGGDNNSIGDVWSDNSADNDQSASAYRQAGIVMMFPSQRGGNNNPGEREGFFGEADDILAATEYLASLPYVDPDRIYLGGHSTGGTMAMIVAALSDRYRAVFAFGPVEYADDYGGDYIYCDVEDEEEIALRSPGLWLDSVKSPMFVIEGNYRGNISSLRSMMRSNTNPQIQFIEVSGHDHFSVLAPVNAIIAQKILSGRVQLDERTLGRLE